MINDVQGLAIYKYTSEIRKAILQLKASGDIELAKIFLGPIKEFLECQYSTYILLPAPSMASQNKKRGFNHVVEMIKPLNLAYKECFYKKQNWKQSSHNKVDRHQIEKVIGIKSYLIDINRKYLIVDDIFTTGQTLNACINALLKVGVKRSNVRLLVVAIHHQIVE